jgi:predicted phage tail protein
MTSQFTHKSNTGTGLTIYGEGKGGKGGGSAPIEEDDTLASKQVLRVLYAVSNGPIHSVQEVYINRVKLAQDADGKYNIPGVITDYRDGDIAQAVIRGFSAVEAASGIATPLKVRKSGNQYQIIPVPASRDRLRITMVLDSLRFVDEDGNIRKYEVSFSFATGLNGTYSSFDIGSKQTVTKSGKSSGAYAFDVIVEKPAAAELITTSWYVLVERVTEDDDDAITKRTKYSSATIAALTEITDVKLTYPTTALIGMTFLKAKRLGGAFPDLIYKVRGILVPVPSATYYTPETGTYSGIWNLTSWANIGYPSANPAWQILYLLRDTTFGLGISDSDIDIGAFYAFAKYCDEAIPMYEFTRNEATGQWTYEQTSTRRRYELHNQFNEREPAIQMLAYFYSAGIARPTISKEGLHSVVWDRPRLPSILVTNNNVVDGVFTYGSNSLDERYTTVTAIYNDINEVGKTTTVTVPLTSSQDDWEAEERMLAARYGYKSLDLPLIGCYNRDQAIVKARWALYRNSILTETLAFAVLFDGLSFEIGDIIQVMDEFRDTSAMHGRIEMAIPNSRKLLLDRQLTFVGGTPYTIHYYSATGLKSKQIVPDSADTVTTNIVTLTVAATPTPESPFIITSSVTAGTLWEIVGLSVSEDTQQIAVSCVAYSDALYEYMARKVKIEKNPVYATVSPAIYTVPPVENASISSSAISALQPNMLVKWEWFYDDTVRQKYRNMQAAYAASPTTAQIPYIPNPYTPEFEVWYQHSPTGEAYTKIETNLMEVEIPKVTDGLYTFKIFAVNAKGVPSVPVTIADYSPTIKDLDTVTYTTGILDASETETGSFTIFKKYDLEYIEVSAPCKIKLYRGPIGTLPVTIDELTLETQQLDQVIMRAEYTDKNYVPFFTAEITETDGLDIDPPIRGKHTKIVGDSYDLAQVKLSSTAGIKVINLSGTRQAITVRFWVRKLA